MRYAVLVVVGCGRGGFEPLEHADAAGAIDAAGPSDAPCVLGPWSAPARIANLSSAVNDYGGTLTADGLIFCYASAQSPGAGGLDLWCATRATAADPFPAPSNVAGVNTSANQSDVVISPDGLELFFSEMPAGNKDIYVATRPDRATAFGGSTPVIATAAPDEESEAMSPDGLRLYFSRRPAVGGTQFYVAERPAIGAAFGAPVEIVSLNSPSDDEGLSLSADELEAYFSSNRPGGLGRLDVRRATRADRAAAFGPAAVVPELVTVNDDLSGVMSADGTTFYFNYDMNLSGSIDSDTWVSTRGCQ